MYYVKYLNDDELELRTHCKRKPPKEMIEMAKQLKLKIRKENDDGVEFVLGPLPIKKGK